jgi:hypothetical protein
MRVSVGKVVRQLEVGLGRQTSLRVGWPSTSTASWSNASYWSLESVGSWSMVVGLTGRAGWPPWRLVDCWMHRPSASMTPALLLEVEGIQGGLMQFRLLVGSGDQEWGRPTSPCGLYCKPKFPWDLGWARKLWTKSWQPLGFGLGRPIQVEVARPFYPLFLARL